MMEVGFEFRSFWFKNSVFPEKIFTPKAPKGKIKQTDKNYILLYSVTEHTLSVGKYFSTRVRTKLSDFWMTKSVFGNR